MAKISRVGGFTDARARGFVSPADELRTRGKLGPYDVEFELEDSVPDDVPSEELAVEKEEEPWAGSSSETSPARPPKSAEPKKPSPQKRARSGERPSSSTTASGTAQTGTTSTPETDA